VLSVQSVFLEEGEILEEQFLEGEIDKVKEFLSVSIERVVEIEERLEGVIKERVKEILIEEILIEEILVEEILVEENL
jgi:hypothetical protein